MIKFIIVLIIAIAVGLAVSAFVHPALGLAAVFGTFVLLYKS
jgi:tetrahydromethanopterin S-methyltransferase subunit E